MEDSFKAECTASDSNYSKTTDPNKWLKELEEKGELINCVKRSARMHKRFCSILRRATPNVSESGYIDKSLKSINVCNDCEITKRHLSVRKFLDMRFNKE